MLYNNKNYNVGFIPQGIFSCWSTLCSKGTFVLCPGINPNSHNRSTQNCASDITGARSHWSIYANRSCLGRGLEFGVPWHSRIQLLLYLIRALQLISLFCPAVLINPLPCPVPVPGIYSCKAFYNAFVAIGIGGTCMMMVLPVSRIWLKRKKYNMNNKIIFVWYLFCNGRCFSVRIICCWDEQGRMESCWHL